MEDQCEAYTVISPEATLEERRCTKKIGAWIFDSYYGPRRLCDSHAKSYKDSGLALRNSVSKHE